MSPAVEPGSGRRRRGDELTAAIFQAVRGELDENGYAAITMETIAKRAGTGKAALYRRWPSRTELIIDTVQATMPGMAGLPDTGSLRGDILALLDAFASELRGALGDALRGLRAEAILDPSLSRQISDYTGDFASSRLRQLVGRAAARGELGRSDVGRLRLEAGPAIIRDHFLFRDLHELSMTDLVDEVIMPLVAGADGSAAISPA
jgi:AcrR family transcriptional regulator